MTRRRLILAIVAAVLCGVACWLSLDCLSAEERLLVGTWTFGPKSAPSGERWQFWPDGRSAYGRIQPNGAVRMIERDGRWFVRSGELVFDQEPSAMRRMFRRALLRIGSSCDGAITFRIDSITADEMVLARPNGTRETWTRAPAD